MLSVLLLPVTQRVAAQSLAELAAVPPGSRHAGPPADPAAWPQPTHFISPGGADENDGTSAARPWRTFAHAVAHLRPGEVLGVMDGTYTVETTGLLGVHCGNGGTGHNGTEDQPITVRAIRERVPILRSDGLTPALWITHCRHWNVLGLTAVGADRIAAVPPAYNAESPGMEPVHVLVGVHRSRNIALKRILAARSNRLGLNANNHIYAIEESSHVIVEESEAYEHHRHAMLAWRSEHVTFRRNYVNSRDHWTRAVREGPPAIVEPEDPRARQSAAEAIAFYRSSWGLAENNVIEGANAGFQSHGGDTFSLHPGGSWNQFLGNIALGPDHSRYDARSEPYPQVKPALGLVIRDHVVADARGRGVGIWLSSVTGARVENVTVYRGAGVGFRADERGTTVSCQMLQLWGGCSFALRNALIWQNTGPGVQSTGQDEWQVEHTNSHANGGGNYLPSEEAIADGAGHIRHSRSIAPTGMGLGAGQCLAFVPPGSNMKGLGKGGADIGANVLYRYVDGTLTGQPLWHPRTGAFPHGAQVKGVNDRPGDSLFDVHKRLNINTNGCALPYVG
jgi:hypothetical protein